MRFMFIYASLKWLILVRILTLVCAGGLLATAGEAQTTILDPSSDTYLKSGSPNQNLGTSTFLRIQQSGSNRPLVRFDSPQIAAAVGAGALVSATLQLYIQDNGNNWGASGQTVGVYRLSKDWTEAGATWNCPIDANPANAQPDCNPQWNGGTFASSATSTVLHANGLTGWVQFNVTTDVSAFLSGTPNDGWIIRKINESQNGLADYTSRQGTSGQGPKLVLVVESPTADQVPPSVRVTTPTLPAIFDDPTPQVVFEYSDNGTGVDTTSVRLFVDSADATSGCMVGPSTATCEPPPLAAGTHQLRAEVKDQAGNVGVATYAFQLFLGSGPHLLTLQALADTYLRQGSPNQNQGAEALLRERDSGNNRVLVRFDQVQLGALLAGQTLVSATIELFIEYNGNNWGSSGATVDVHRLTADWAELQTTWNCPADANPANAQPDCATQWAGGSFASAPTAGILHTNGLTGWVQANVTPDVAAYLSGAPNDGWLLKKTKEALSGLVEYTSREGATTQRPRLVLVAQSAILSIDISGVSDGQATNSDLTITYAASGATSLTANLTKDGGAATPFVSGTTLSAEGRYVLTVQASDGSGTRTETRSFIIDKTPPQISATASPTPNAAGWNNTDVTVSFQAEDGLSGVASVPPPVTVATEGVFQLVIGTAVDVAGNSGTAVTGVSIDRTVPAVTLTAPVAGTVRRLPRVRVSGVAADANAIAMITVNGVAADTGAAFEVEVPLQQGSQTLTVEARDIAGNVGTASTSVVYRKLPVVEITSPSDLAAFGMTPIAVSGTVDDPQAVVRVGVEQIPAEVSGNAFTATGVSLREGGNVLTAVATNIDGEPGTDSITVVLDTVAPRVIIDSPASGSVMTEASITVAGRVNDVVMGTVNSGQATVSVNGIPAVVSHRTFMAEGVALHPGQNSIVAIATDAVGNVDTKAITVLRETAPGPRIQVVSGNAQTAGIGEPLPLPLVVSVTDGQGNGLPGRTVIFRVAENNGTLLDGAGASVRGATVLTDAGGKGEILFALGSRAGAGNNRVEASSPGVPGAAILTLSALPHSPAKINLDSGNSQKGVVGQPLPRPFVVVVTDEGHNRLANIPVTFEGEQGEGTFNGETSLTVNTDTDGRAVVVLTLGPEAGVEGNVVKATVADLSGLPVGFVATGFEPGDPAATRISGVVLDNSNVPILGVTLRIRGTALAVQSDAHGQFTLGNVPVGDIHLIADGSTAQRPGTWPDLEFEIVTVAGATNTLGMPIFLLPLDTSHGIFVDETHGGTLTIPDVPGFSLTVAPNSATFPDGTRRGTITVTPVHPDKVPMVPNFGQQPRFIVTIQPPGVRFDPPAAITHPNVDGLAPGEVTELYSFDHDMGSFVATGTATVSDDGSVLTSDPGTGIVKGGWHCGGNPSTAGTAAKCPDCARCDGRICKTDYEELGRCCFGQRYEDDTQCCRPNLPPEGQTRITTGRVVPKNPIQSLADCPFRSPRGAPGVLGTTPNFRVKYDGCTAVNNNPAGAPDTEFSTFLCRSTGLDVNCNAGCDFHDRCYQTCNNSKAGCDSSFLSILLATCDASEASLPVRLNCRAYAHEYHLGVAQFGQAAYDHDQEQVCKCCP